MRRNAQLRLSQQQLRRWVRSKSEISGIGTYEAVLPNKAEADAGKPNKY
jgi:hypothetical protein